MVIGCDHESRSIREVHHTERRWGGGDDDGVVRVEVGRLGHVARRGLAGDDEVPSLRG